MARFVYRAYQADGRVVSDVVSAVSESEAVRELMTQGLTPFELKQAGAGGAQRAAAGNTKQAPRVLAGFFRNLASMLAGGLPLDEALKLLASDPEDKRVARLSNELRNSVLTGRSLADAMAGLKAPPQDYVIGLIRAGDAKKGDVLGTARLAGIMAAKRTHELIPLCHPLMLSKVSLELTLDDTLPGVRVTAEVRVGGQTGVEMEALTAVSVACLTIYDMVKAVDRGMRIEAVQLLHKSGGKSGVYEREPSAP